MPLSATPSISGKSATLSICKILTSRLRPASLRDAVRQEPTEALAAKAKHLKHRLAKLKARWTSSRPTEGRYWLHQARVRTARPTRFQKGTAFATIYEFCMNSGSVCPATAPRCGARIAALRAKGILLSRIGSLYDVTRSIWRAAALRQSGLPSQKERLQCHP
jgi:hypothetical protein